MIRALRRRFILGAMLALTILLTLLIGGITCVGYIHMETSADALLNRMAGGDTPHPPVPSERPAFGYNLPNRASPDGHYILTLDQEGNLLDTQTRGTWETEDSILEELAREILSAGENRGKISGYKYRVQPQEDNSIRIFLLDLSVQAHMLLDVLRISSLIGLIALTGMFLILLPLSKRLVGSYAASIEKQKRFITDAGHEIKTPVAIILSNIDAMELIQGENKWSRNIRSQVDRLNHLLKQLLAMARMDEQSVTFPLKNIDFAAMLREESAAYAELLQKRRIDFSMDLASCRPIRGNRETLCQLVHILMDNAVQYADEGGSVTLRLERRSRGVRILLSNTVDHLPDCPPDALFERFFRADSARTQSSGGCGVGLSAAQSIVQLHRGRISVSYADDPCILFTLDLPS